MMEDLNKSDFSKIREGIAALGRAPSHEPNAAVDPIDVVMVPGHRASLDPDRTLVVGNRGMGKSFWTHALANEKTRAEAAKTFRELESTDVLIGFNAAETPSPIAPTPLILREALERNLSPDTLWLAVLVRIAFIRLGRPFPQPGMESFLTLVQWVKSNSELVEGLSKELDEFYTSQKRKLLVVFDALDRLGKDWQTTRVLTIALLKRALAVRSYRSIRIKLFMRRDQFEDPALFLFADGSKVRNTRVDLSWSSSDLYRLLFSRLERSPIASESFIQLKNQIERQANPTHTDKAKLIVDLLAGEFMGAGEKRGRVYTWLPLHLSDAREETSPRTFLTAWTEAAKYGDPPATMAINHHGLMEGVRKASEDRLSELAEDYHWIKKALEPLKGQFVPIQREALLGLWRSFGTVTDIKTTSTPGLSPVQFEDSSTDLEGALLSEMKAIGVIEERTNGKINVPDIFRVEAGIKRKGGVKPPRKS